MTSHTAETNHMALPAYWEHFQHGSDMGIRGVGRNMAEAFEEAAKAMTAIICDPRRIATWRTVDVQCRNADREMLFVDWIDAVVYEMATRQMLFSQFHVEIHGDELRARLKGEPINRVRHRPAVEIKGATLTELMVRHKADCWTAQCVVEKSKTP